MFFTQTWGKSGTNSSEFNYPTYLTIYDERLYVSDTGNHRIQVFKLNGEFIHKWGKKGKENGEFNEPHGIVCFNELIYVAVIAIIVFKYLI